MKYPVVNFEVSMGLVWFLAAHLLIFRVVFLFFWRISVVRLVLELFGLELGFSW